jgi:hypothetical protein
MSEVKICCEKCREYKNKFKFSDPEIVVCRLCAIKELYKIIDSFEFDKSEDDMYYLLVVKNKIDNTRTSTVYNPSKIK